MKKVHIILVITACWVVSCQRSHTPHYIPRPSDSLYTADLAAHIYADDPERALVVLDSAYLVGNTSEFRRDYLRATIYGRQQINPQKGEALDICEELLQHDSTRTDSRSTAMRRLDVLNLMTAIYRDRKDYENYLKYAYEIVSLNRAWGNETEVLRAEAEIGLALTILGRQEEGLQKLDEVRAALSRGAPSIDRLDAWIVVTKRKMNTLGDLGRYDEVARLAQEIIKRLDAYQAHPENYAEDSRRLPPIKEDRDRWCDFYRSQAHGFLGYAYAMSGKETEARKEVAIFEASDHGRTYSGRRMISRAWVPLKEWDKLMAIDDEVATRMGADTLNIDYATILHDRSLVAKARGRYVESREWLDRYARLKDELADRMQASQALEYAAVYHESEQDRALAEVKAEALRKDQFILFTMIMLAMAVAAVFYYSNQQNRIEEKNKALVRMIHELSEKAKHAAALAAAPKHAFEDEDTFLLIDKTIREEKLYANSQLQRQDILDRFNIRRQTLNDLLNEYTLDRTFPGYVNSIRMEEAVKILQDDPSQTFAAIAEAVGLNPANFRIQFKQYFGMTPAEYREETLKDQA